MDTARLHSSTTVGGPRKSFIESIPTSGLAPEEVIKHLNSFDIDWWLSDSGDLFIRYWQVGAEDFVPVERVAEVRTGKLPPPEADKLEWVSKQLDTLRASYAGKWVAITDDGVSASASDLGELMSILDDEGIDQPLVTQIPEGPIIWNTAYADD